MSIRSLLPTVKVADATARYDTIHLRVFYPAQMPDRPLQPVVGGVPADPQQAPFPVFIFLGGIDCRAEVYRWLAVKLAAREELLTTVVELT